MAKKNARAAGFWKFVCGLSLAAGLAFGAAGAAFLAFPVPEAQTAIGAEGVPRFMVIRERLATELFSYEDGPSPESGESQGGGKGLPVSAFVVLASSAAAALLGLAGLRSEDPAGKAPAAAGLAACAGSGALLYAEALASSLSGEQSEALIAFGVFRCMEPLPFCTLAPGALLSASCAGALAAGLAAGRQGAGKAGAQGLAGLGAIEAFLVLLSAMLAAAAAKASNLMCDVVTRTGMLPDFGRLPLFPWLAAAGLAAGAWFVLFRAASQALAQRAGLENPGKAALSCAGLSALAGIAGMRLAYFASFLVSGMFGG